MDALFNALIEICKKLQVVSDFLWEFPCNLDWYASIPILGNFSIAILLLVGTGIFFTFRFGFVQFRYFAAGIRTLAGSVKKRRGISPLASFLLSSAMRVGPGNILGVTGAISIGGPGALLWMWISAIFAMATSFAESTLSQIFKEKHGDEYVGGMAYYGRKLCGGLFGVGVALSLLYIIYAFLCLPAQGFNTISGILSIGQIFTGESFEGNSPVGWIAFIIMMIFIAVLAFGGIKKITKFTDICVPIMAVAYFITCFILIAINCNKIPWFFYAVITEAFMPEALFGGAFGVALSQGIRRGLMSNEAGQGTISMPAAASDAKHPCEQGNVQSIGVFFDTVVICTPTAFIVIMSQAWFTEGWMDLGKLDKFFASCGIMSGGGGIGTQIVFFIVCVCFSLFAITTLIGFISFTEICAKRISKSKIFILVIRILCLAVIAFGVLCNFAGLDLSALWNLSDMANILMVYCNIPLLFLGLKYTERALNHYDVYHKFFDAKDNIIKYERRQRALEKQCEIANQDPLSNASYMRLLKAIEENKAYVKKHEHEYWRFTSEVAGLSLPVWDEKREKNEL